MFCINCGREISGEDKYCRYCGTATAVASGVQEPAPIKIPKFLNHGRKKDAGPSATAPKKVQNGKKGAKLKLLVIDDDPVFLEGYLFKFEMEGFNVVLARNGKEGLEFAKKENPSVILLDILMPGMNGLEVLRKLKEDPATRDIPVVLATIVDEKNTMEQGLALGADYYITKDVMNSDNVVEKVRAAAMGVKE